MENVQNMNSENQKILTRRRFIKQLGIGGAAAVTLSGCSGATVLQVISELSTTSGDIVDWQYLVQQMNSGVSHVATQTKTILKVQQSYTNVYELKEEEAAIKAEIDRIESGNVNNVDLRATSNVSESAKVAVLAKAKEKQDLSNSQKQVLSRGLTRHHGAVSRAWVGGARITRVLIQATKAKRPEVEDLYGCATQISLQIIQRVAEDVKNNAKESSENASKEKNPNETETLNVLEGECKDLGNAVSILVNAPIALNFLQASKDSYEAHAEAFEYEAKVPVAASYRKLDLEPFDIEKA